MKKTLRKEVKGRLKSYIVDNPIGSTVMFIVLAWMLVAKVWNEYQLEYGDIRISSTLENLSELDQTETNRGLTNAFHYAVLSADVYPKRNKDSWEKTCDRGAIYEQWQILGLPVTIPNKPVDRQGDQVMVDSELVYEVWWRNVDHPEHDVEVALVFAGTDGLGDIWSNLFWVTQYWPGGWNQYDLARTLGPAIKEFADQFFSGKKVNVITAGHSLGGGLAHQAAYATEGIDTVYAFDSSSVTGFYSVDKEIRDKNKIGMRIFRIHERGEILGYLRSFMALFYPVVEKNPQIIEAAVNFDSGTGLSEHSIENLACALVEHGG